MSPDEDMVGVVVQYHPWLRTAAETGSYLPDLESGGHRGVLPSIRANTAMHHLTFPAQATPLNFQTFLPPTQDPPTHV